MTRINVPPEEKSYTYSQYKYISSGKLILKMHMSGWSNYYEHKIRSAYSNGKKHTLDEQRGDIILNLHRGLIEKKRLHQTQKWQELKAARQKRLDETKLYQMRNEEDKKQQLIEYMQQSAKAEKIRSYVKSCVRQALSRKGQINSGEFASWVRWALKYANSIDPVISKF